MDDRNESPPSSSLSPAVDRRLRQQATEEDGGNAASCTGKSCQSCTAGVIADCVAVCCCPCAVVNIFVLAFFKLPYAVARRCLRGRRKSSRRRMLRDRDGNIPEKGRAELEFCGEEVNVNFSAEEVWMEVCEVGHLGFGRVSFTGINFQRKGN